MDYVYRNARRCSFFIIKLAKTKNIWTLLLLYKTYVRSKLEYCTPLWSPFFSKDIKKIEKIQKDFTRIAFKKCGLPETSYENRLYQLNLNSLQYRRIVFDLVFMHKIVYGLAGLDFQKYFVLKKIPYQLRSKEIQIAPKIQYKGLLWTNSFFSRTPKYWNFLPESLTQISDPYDFKRKLKNIDLTNYIKPSS